MENFQISPKTKTLETYADDMVEAIKSGQGGLVKKIIEEQNKEEALKRKLDKESSHSRFYIYLGVFFLLVAVSAVAGAFLFKEGITTLEVVPKPTPILFTDKTETIDVSGKSAEEIAVSVKSLIDDTDLGVGKVREISLIENGTPVGLERFLSLIEASFPLARTDLVSDLFIGVLGKNSGVPGEVGSELFFLIKTLSFYDVFPTMRFWEDKVFSELYEFFGIDLNSENNYLLIKDFEDGFILNKNARILYDNNRGLVFYYAFIDDKTIVIATTPEPVREVMLRISAGEVRK